MVCLTLAIGAPFGYNSSLHYSNLLYDHFYSSYPSIQAHQDLRESLSYCRRVYGRCFFALLLSTFPLQPSKALEEMCINVCSSGAVIPTHLTRLQIHISRHTLALWCALKARRASVACSEADRQVEWWVIPRTLYHKLISLISLYG